MKVRDRMLTVLGEAQKERDARPDLIKTEEYPFTECAWALYERTRMMDEVNAVRKEINKPPVEMRDVTWIENMAAGHSDYSSKFALYCAELALDELPEHEKPNHDKRARNLEALRGKGRSF